MSRGEKLIVDERDVEITHRDGLARRHGRRRLVDDPLFMKSAVTKLFPQGARVLAFGDNRPLEPDQVKRGHVLEKQEPQVSR